MKKNFDPLRIDQPVRPNFRHQRVGQEIRHALSEIILKGDFSSQSKNYFLTITHVDVSPDLRYALVFVVPLQGVNQGDVVNDLQKHCKEIRYLMAKALTLRYVPHIRFKLDHTFDYASKIDTLLSHISKTS